MPSLTKGDNREAKSRGAYFRSPKRIGSKTKPPRRKQITKNTRKPITAAGLGSSSHAAFMLLPFWASGGRFMV